MIRPVGESLPVYVCLAPVDFRKQSVGLAAFVQVELELNPFDPAVFAFTNRRRNAAKLLLWERNGHVLWHKRLDEHRYHWPRAADVTPGGEGGEATITLSVQQLNWILDGLDLTHWRPHTTLSYRYAA